MSDLGPLPDPDIEPGEPNPGGADALQEDPESLGAIPDLSPEENPAIEEGVPETVKQEVAEGEDTSTKATRSEEGADDETDKPEEDSPGMNEKRNPDEELRASNPNMSGPEAGAGGMGVSSERVGHAGPGQESTDGVRDVSEHERDPDQEILPEQATGNAEDNPQGIPPKAGYPSKDPRSADKPFKPEA